MPPEWHAWLHYTTDTPLAETARRPWQKPHLANATGTAFSPTDVSAIKAWAKLMMMAEEAVSLVVALLVVARAVNILK